MRTSLFDRINGVPDQRVRDTPPRMMLEQKQKQKPVGRESLMQKVVRESDPAPAEILRDPGYGRRSLTERIQDAGPAKPQDANVAADSRVFLHDLIEHDEDPMDIMRRRTAQRVKSVFGDQAARFLYGDDIVDSIPDQTVPLSYKDAYVKDGEWFIPGRGKVPPPPKELLEKHPDLNLVEKSLQWVLPEQLIHLRQTVNDLFNSGAWQREQAINDILKEAALYLPFMKIGKGAEVLGRESIAGVGAELLKRIGKAGIAPPRLVLKALANLDGRFMLPVREKLWEILTWPLEKHIIPTYEGDVKSVKEIFQPAIERVNKSVRHTFRQGQSQRQLITEIGQDLGNEVRNLTPVERFSFGEAMRGEPINPMLTKEQKQRVISVVDSLKQRTKLLNLDKRYEKHFYDRLNHNLRNSDFDFGYGLEGEMPMLEAVAQRLGKSLSTQAPVKETQKVLKQLIENPMTPKATRALAMDLHNMPAATPEAVGEAARFAMRHTIVDSLRNSPFVQVTLGQTSDPKRWLLSKHPLMEGLHVERDVELELRALEEIPKMAQRTFSKWFMTPWKTSKVILRPATHFRNMVSNTILNDWGGLPFYRMDVYADALKQMKGKSALWNQFRRITGAGGTFSTEEVNQLAAGLKYGSNRFDHALAQFDRMVAPSRSIYNAEEQWSKFAKFIWNKKQGMTPVEAAYDAMKWTFNYGEITRSTAFTRGYLSPFYTWTSKVLPLMAETMVKHPWRVGKWVGMYYGLQNLATQNLRISDREWERFEHILPDYIREGQMLLVPFRDAENRLQMLNLTYMIPGFGDLNEIAGDPISSIIGHPLALLAGALSTKTKWSGAPLYYDWEAPTTKMAKVFAYTWEMFVPSWAPGGTDWHGIMKRIHEEPDAPTWEQMMASSVGFKVLPIDEASARRKRKVIDDIHRAEIGSAMKRELRGVRDSNKRRKIIQHYQDLRREIGE